MEQDPDLPIISLPLHAEQLTRIATARGPREIRTVITTAIANLPGVRVYVCEPNPKGKEWALWDVAYDLTITMLQEAGYSVVDGSLIRMLMKLNRVFHRVVVDRNPLLQLLIDLGLVDVVCIPGNLTEEEYDGIRREISLARQAVETMVYAAIVDPQ